MARSIQEAYMAAKKLLLSSEVKKTNDSSDINLEKCATIIEPIEEATSISKIHSTKENVSPSTYRYPNKFSKPKSSVGKKKKANADEMLRRTRAIFDAKRIVRQPYSPPRYTRPIDLRPPRVQPASNGKPSVRLSFNGEPKVKWSPVAHVNNVQGDFYSQLGRRMSICEVRHPTPRQLVMGIDFGTSSTKVVLGDRGLKSAYAVPFTEMAGVSAYLLPTHLCETNGVYEISSRGIVHNDLKLAMLSEPSNAVFCSRVCAYLALVIRAVRSWIFINLREQYIAADLVWSLAIGQPADQATSLESKDLFRRIGAIAWHLAGLDDEITAEHCLGTWKTLELNSIDPDDIEVLVMPELAAQIYGFVSSVSFDPKHPNIYLLVDVGAGTVDASVFKVEKGMNGAASFSFFTNAVESLGAMNLHRSRVDWWQTKLRAFSLCSKVVSDLEKIRLPTEYRGPLPDNYLDYVDGVSVSLDDGALSPDQEFFLKIRNQVAGKVLYGVQKNNLLDKQSISGLPFFLCGGGARYDFYKNLKTELKKQPGCSWLNASFRELTLPSILRADGVNKSDYDRLSVAYGLSQLDSVSVNQISAMQPRVFLSHDSDWRDNYFDKSYC